jgi:hypothetical protein
MEKIEQDESMRSNIYHLSHLFGERYSKAVGFFLKKLNPSKKCSGKVMNN